MLPQRNLLRQLTWSMHSGQSIAGAMGTTPLSKQDLKELKPYGFDTSTPLWYYALKEAELLAQGLHLGPIAGRIVAEVLIGLLQADPNSYLNANPSWQPTLQNPGPGFRMTDFLAYAGSRPGHPPLATTQIRLIGRGQAQESPTTFARSTSPCGVRSVF